MPLAAHYPLQEDAGDAHDATGNGNTGTVTGATQGASGILGATAYSFDGTDDYVGINALAPQTPPLTYSAWFTTTATDQFPALIGQRSSTSTTPIISVQLDSDLIRASVRDDSGTITTVDSTTTVNNGDWYHVVATMGSNIRLYVNGTEENSGTTPGGSFSTDTFNVGAAESDTGVVSYWTGDISNVRVYDHALTPSEVQYLCDVGTTGSILTETYTHGSSIQPDLRADVTLSGESATGYVVGSPGTASEERQSVTLSAGSNDYSLTWASGHTDFRVRVVADLSTPAGRVEANRVALLN